MPDIPRSARITRPACIILTVFTATMAACTAAPRQSDDAARAQFEQYAGPPIDSFTYLGRYNGFRTLGNKTLVVWTSINDAYLITVRDPCIRLPFANGIGLTSTTHTVDRRFDWVILGRSPADRCHIDTIRKVDYLRMKQELRSAPQATGSGPAEPG